MRRRIIIIGSNYSSTLGIVKSIAGDDYDIIVIKIGVTKDIVSRSKFVSQYVVLNTEDPDILKEYLIKYYGDKETKPLLIPVMDQVVKSIDINYKELKDFFLLATINDTQGAIVQYMDKHLQKSLAIKAGFKVAKDWKVSIVAADYLIPSDIVYPCFTKAVKSVNGGKTFIKKCDTQEDLKRVLDLVAEKWQSTDVLIEEYKTIQQEYGVLGCCVSGKTYLPALVTKLSIGQGGHIGVTIQGKVSPIDEAMPGLREKLQLFLSQFNYTGLCDFDLYMADNEFYFNEMNLRYGGFGFAIVGAGMNLPLLYADSMFHKPGRGNQSISEIICLSDKANLDSFIAGYSDWKQYKARIKASSFRFIVSQDDIRPTKAFLAMEARARIRNILKSLSKKFKIEKSSLN